MASAKTTKMNDISTTNFKVTIEWMHNHKYFKENLQREPHIYGSITVFEFEGVQNCAASKADSNAGSPS